MRACVRRVCVLEVSKDPRRHSDTLVGRRTGPGLPGSPPRAPAANPSPTLSPSLQENGGPGTKRGAATRVGHMVDLLHQGMPTILGLGPQQRPGATRR